MTGLNTDNKRFYQRLYDHSEKLEKITLLDDIKKIKNSLETEVSQIRQAVNDQKKLELHSSGTGLSGRCFFNDLAPQEDSRFYIGNCRDYFSRRLYLS